MILIHSSTFFFFNNEYKGIVWWCWLQHTGPTGTFWMTLKQSSAYIPSHIFSVIHLQVSLLIYLNTRKPGGKSVNSPRRNCSYLCGLNLQLALPSSRPASFTPSEGSYIMPAASFPGGSSLRVNCRKKRADFKRIVVSVHHNIVSSWTLDSSLLRFCACSLV